MRERLVMSYHDFRFEDWFVAFRLCRSTGHMKPRAVCYLSTIAMICSSIRYLRGICAIFIIGLWDFVLAEVHPAMIETISIKIDMLQHASFSQAFREVPSALCSLDLLSDVNPKRGTVNFQPSGNTGIAIGSAWYWVPCCYSGAE